MPVSRLLLSHWCSPLAHSLCMFNHANVLTHSPAHLVGKVLYWLLERCQYSILVAFASILKILQYPGGCQYTGSGGQYTGSGCLTYCHYMAVRLVLLQCFGVLH